MSAATAEPRQPRLSPFVFPSDTTFRFALLVVAVLGANLYVWNWLWIALGADQQAVRAAYDFCVRTYTPTLDIRGIDATAYAAVNDAFTACVQQVNHPLAWWMVGGTVLLIAVAAVILLLFPRWIVRRRRLQPLTHEEAPAVVDELRALAHEAELAEEPRWVWNPLDPSPTGLAFGRPGSHAVALMGGLVTRQIADPPAFRSVVRHELAHLRNRDVDLTYATLSLWYAFLLVGVLPFALVVADEGLDTVVALGWRLAALAALVYLTRNAVLRAREVYADVRASVPDGPQGALRRILGGMPRHPTSVWRRLWRVHPDPTMRLAALNDTRRLFTLGPLVAFGTGVAATIAYESLVTFVSIYASDPLPIHLIAAAPFAPLAMGVVGVGIWRGAWGALSEDRARPSTWPLALSLGAGFLLGPQLALERGVRIEGDSTLLETALGSGAPWIALLAVGLVLLLAWVGASATTWIRSLAGAARPTLTTLAGLLFASGLLAVFVAVFTYARDSRSAVGKYPVFDHADVSEVAWVGPTWLWRLVQDAWLLDVFRQPAIFLALVALWVFPFAAWLRRSDHVSNAPWAFLEPGGRLNVPLLGRLAFEPWLIGVIAGATCLGAFVVLRLGLRAGFDAQTRDRVEFVFAFSYWQIVLALAAQAIAGIVAAARLRDMPLVAGLAAAFATGVIATAGIVVAPSVASCVDPIAIRPVACGWYVDSGFTWLVLRQVIGEGALAALAGGIAVLGVQVVLGRRRLPLPRPRATLAR